MFMLMRIIFTLVGIDINIGGRLCLRRNTILLLREKISDLWNTFYSLKQILLNLNTLPTIPEISKDNDRSTCFSNVGGASPPASRDQYRSGALHLPSAVSSDWRQLIRIPGGVLGMDRRACVSSNSSFSLRRQQLRV